MEINCRSTGRFICGRSGPPSCCAPLNKRSLDGARRCHTLLLLVLVQVLVLVLPMPFPVLDMRVVLLCGMMNAHDFVIPAKPHRTADTASMVQQATRLLRQSIYCCWGWGYTDTNVFGSKCGEITTILYFRRKNKKGLCSKCGEICRLTTASSGAGFIVFTSYTRRCL